MELTIKNKTYPLKASFAFLKKIESQERRNTGGEEMDFGLANAVVQLTELADLRYLVDLLVALNTGLSPRLERNVVEQYLEDDCEDIEALIKEVIDFLFAANVCRLKLKKMGLTAEGVNQENNIKA